MRPTPGALAWRPARRVPSSWSLRARPRPAPCLRSGRSASSGWSCPTSRADSSAPATRACSGRGVLGALLLPALDLLQAALLDRRLLPPGAVTALLGGPFFLSMLLRHARGGTCDGPRCSGRGLRFGYEPGQEVLRGVDLTLRAGEILASSAPTGMARPRWCTCSAAAWSPRPRRSCSAGRTRTLDARRCARRGGAPGSRRRRGRARGALRARWALPARPRVALALGPRPPQCGAALERTDATGFAARTLGQLSAGQRQRVHLARALAQESPALLLDEPTSALDPGHQVEVLDLAREQAAAGSGVLVVTHDLNLTSQYAQRVLLLADGAVAAEGTAAEVLRPETLRPVYGERLWFGTFPDSGRPIVLPRGGDASE